MHVPKERKIDLGRQAIERLVHCPENQYRKTLLCECVSAYLPLDEDQRQQFEEMVRNHPDSGVQAMGIGFLDYVEQRGVERGKLEGKLEGQREMLRKQIESRFGPLPPSIVASLQSLESNQLAELACTLLTATSLKELRLGGS